MTHIECEEGYHDHRFYDGRLPYAADLLITEECQLGCTCFRPNSHEVGTKGSTKDWYHLITRLALSGFVAMVFGGGEPLLHPDLPALLYHSFLVGMHNTVSTNGILFPDRHADIMNLVHDIGIPIDGPDPERNARVRPPASAQQFDRAIESIRIIQQIYPSTRLTVRTVVSAINAEYVTAIPDALAEAGIRTHDIRWKLAQFLPKTSCPEAEPAMVISTQEFLRVFHDVYRRYRGEFRIVVPQPIACTEGRHFLILPDFEARLVKFDYPIDPEFDIPALTTVHLGNVATDFEGTAHNFQMSLSPERTIRNLLVEKLEHDWRLLREGDTLRELGEADGVEQMPHV